MWLTCAPSTAWPDGTEDSSAWPDETAGGKYFSQGGEDRYLQETVFENRTTPGVYLDIGKFPHAAGVKGGLDSSLPSTQPPRQS